MASGRIILQSTTKGAGGWDHSLLNRTCSTKDVLTCQSGSCLGSFNTCTLQLPRLADLPRGNPGRGKCTNEGLVLKAATMFRSLLGSFIRGGCARPQAFFFFFYSGLGLVRPRPWAPGDLFWASPSPLHVPGLEGYSLGVTGFGASLLPAVEVNPW